jgi:hypothetical protein
MSPHRSSKTKKDSLINSLNTDKNTKKRTQPEQKAPSTPSILEPTKSTLPNTIQHPRPGRKVDRKYADPKALQSFGTPITTNRDPSRLRIFFQNIKGISYSSTGEDHDYLLHSLDAIAVDIAGLSETNTAWQHAHIRNDFKQRANRHYRQSNISFGTISKDIDELPAKESFQAGGSITMTLGDWTTSVYGPPIHDSTGLG